MGEMLFFLLKISAIFQLCPTHMRKDTWSHTTSDWKLNGVWERGLSYQVEGKSPKGCCLPCCHDYTLSYKAIIQIIMQGCRARLLCKAVVQGCRTRVSCKAVVQGCRTRLSCKAVVQGCRTRLSYKGIVQCSIKEDVPHTALSLPSCSLHMNKPVGWVYM